VYDVFRAAVNVPLVRPPPGQAGLAHSGEDGRRQGLSVQWYHGDGIRMRDPKQRRAIPTLVHDYTQGNSVPRLFRGLASTHRA
jgi:hypothetical protein